MKFSIRDIDIVTNNIYLKDVISMIRNQSINLNVHKDIPPQNKWNSSQESKFVGSLILRLDIGPFYFLQTGLKNNDIALEVVDGLKRLTAIKRFFVDGDVTFSSILPGIYEGFHGSKFIELDIQLQRLFLQSPVTSNVIRSGTPKEIARILTDLYLPEYRKGENLAC